MIVETPLKKADIVVVSTGSYVRFLHAVDLLKKGYSGRLLLLGDDRLPADPQGKNLTHYAREEAIGEGIDEKNIFVSHSTGTQGDARAARAIADSHGYKSAIVVSDGYNMRRIAMIFGKVFHGSPVELIFEHGDWEYGEYFPPERWWQSPYTFSYVVKEWIKLPIDFYFLRGFEPA
ncbi:MAG: YdcF family protein [Nitrospinae bacterium]|nr:YdcF family protein [Nitrospinota bacterium]